MSRMGQSYVLHLLREARDWQRQDYRAFRSRWPRTLYNHRLKVTLMARQEGIRRLSLLISVLAGIGFFLFFAWDNAFRLSGTDWVELSIASIIAGFGAFLVVRGVGWVIE